MKKILVWSLLCIGLLAFLIYMSVKSVKLTEDCINLVVQGYQELTIMNEKVTMEAASEGFFVLRNTKTDEVIIGISEPVPFGWRYEVYYHAPSTQVFGGKWVVETGSSVSIRIDSIDSTDTIVHVNEDGSTHFLLVLLSTIFVFLIWIAGISTLL